MEFIIVTIHIIIFGYVYNKRHPKTLDEFKKKADSIGKKVYDRYPKIQSVIQMSIDTSLSLLQNVYVSRGLNFIKTTATSLSERLKFQEAADIIYQFLYPSHITDISQDRQDHRD